MYYRLDGDDVLTGSGRKVAWMHPTNNAFVVLPLSVESHADPLASANPAVQSYGHTPDDALNRWIDALDREARARQDAEDRKAAAEDTRRDQADKASILGDIARMQAHYARLREGQ